MEKELKDRIENLFDAIEHIIWFDSKHVKLQFDALKKQFIKSMDSYSQPAQIEAEEKGKEDVRCPNCGELIGNCDMSCYYKESPSDQPSVTDEEIEYWAEQEINIEHDLVNIRRKMWSDGAEWMRDQLIK